MSVIIPYQTQLNPKHINSQCKGDDTRVVLVITKCISVRQRNLMNECAVCLEQIFETKAITYFVLEDDLKNERSPFRCFVVPSVEDKSIIETIKRSFANYRIFLPRAIIETKYFNLECLPVGRTVISLSMHKSKIFLVKECNTEDIKRRIVNMSGRIAKRMEEANIVVSDKANRSKLSKAFKLNIPVISVDWINHSYHKSLEDDENSFFYDAHEEISKFKIKPFHGLMFRFAKNFADQNNTIKSLIIENGGHIYYGNDEMPELNHKIWDKCSSDGDEMDVDVAFLRACIDLNRYIAKANYRKSVEQKASVERNDIVEQTSSTKENPTNSNELSNCLENVEFKEPFNPAMMATQARVGMLNDMYSRVLTDDNTLAQPIVSTQVRNMPDPDYYFERAPEPSQVLYWQDNVSKESRRRMY